jgi:hypothetical protein
MKDRLVEHEYDKWLIIMMAGFTRVTNEECFEGCE